MAMKSKFIDIDLSRMLEHPKCAIHLPTQEDALLILANAKRQFPDRVKRWAEDDGYWPCYKEETAYTFFFNEDKHPSTMSYANVTWFADHGYEVIELSELLYNCADINESDFSVEDLIGAIGL